MANNKPLVTIGVLAYNSANTILDTLDSIALQTYDNIELIICNDGSTDNTLIVVKNWLKEHAPYFDKAKIVTVNQNTGTPSNCNRLLKHSKGEWLKMIAADDILLPNCIDAFVSYVNNNPNARAVYSNYNSFIKDADGNLIVKGPKLTDEINESFNTDATTQLYTYIEKGFNISPAVFINLELAKSIGFIEKYKVFEDTPFYVRILKGGTKIYHLNEDTVLYRNDGDSVTREKTRVHFYKQIFVENVLLFRKEMIFSLYPWYKFAFWIREYSFRFQYFFTIKVLHNRRTVVNLIIYNIIKAINPYYLIKFICDKIC